MQALPFELHDRLQMLQSAGAAGIYFGFMWCVTSTSTGCACLCRPAGGMHSRTVL